MYINPIMQVAQHLISRADEDLTPITPMKLNILTYICHGWMLATYGQPLAQEPVIAKRFGPCIPEISPLTMHGKLPAPDCADSESVDSFEMEIANEVYNGYGGCSDLKLFQLVRGGYTPWNATWHNDNSGNAIIDDDLIQDHFVSMLADVQPAAAFA